MSTDLRTSTPCGDITATVSDRYSHGLGLYRQGRYTEALGELSAIPDGGDPIGTMARFYKAMCHRAIGVAALSRCQFDLAEENLKRALALVGRTGDLASHLAALYASTGKTSQCVNEMEKVCDQEADRSASWRKLALAQWRQGSRPQAYMTLTEALRRLGDDCELHLQLGLFHAAEGQYPQAKAALTSAMEADGANPDVQYYLALTAAAQGQTLEALRHMQRAFEFRPDDLMTAYQLAIVAKAAMDAGHAVTVRLPDRQHAPEDSQMRQLARYVCQEPDYVEAFLELPPTPSDQDLFGLLAAVLQTALSEHPEYADLHYLCSRALDRLGRTDAAIEHCARALAINPRYLKALVHAADLCQRGEQFDQAVGYLRRAVQAGGNWADVHCKLGELFKRSGDYRRASEHFRRALDINAGYARPAEELRSLAA